MPIMELTLQQSYQGQECINRWNYLASGTPSAVSFSFALVSAFGAIPEVGVYPTDTPIALIRLIQDSSVSFEEVVCKDVYSVTDFYSTPFVPGLNGSVSGEGLSPISNYGFRTNRTRLDIRRATKRFVGIPETNVIDGGVINGAVLAGAVTDVATIMTDTLEYDDEGNTLSFAPIVVSKEQYETNPGPPPRYAYRYYATEAEQEDHIMESILWEPYDTVRSQVSRQYGRGR